MGCNVRLSEEQRKSIVAVVKECLGRSACVLLFGSRTRDDAKGGDIDLLITTDMTDVDAIVRAEVRCQVLLEQTLGNQKIDLLIDYPTRRQRPPVMLAAHAQGQAI